MKRGQHLGRGMIAVLVVFGVLSLSTDSLRESAVAESDSRIDTLIASMSTREKVGQVFMINLGGSQVSPAQVTFLQTYRPGGVVLFGRNVDGRTPTAITHYVNQLQQTYADVDAIPLLIATDHEGGRVQRLLDGFTHFPEPSILGATADTEIAHLVGQAQGRELSAVGVNMNLAPVADLHTRADMLNTARVMNHRTISQNPNVVGELSAALVDGLASQQVIGVIKHFPGHSPTETDSHREIATVNLNRTTAETTNLRAFELAIDAGAPAVMMGHLYYPAFEPIENLPASLSPTMVRLLRDDLAFDGVIMTDALDMGAVVNLYPTPTAAVVAFEAGVDVLTMGPNVDFDVQLAALEGLHAAVEAGTISEERLDASVRRILELKLAYGLLDWTPLDTASTEQRMRTDLSSDALIRLFEAGITVVRDTAQELPLQDAADIAIIYPAGKPTIFETCQQRLPQAAFQSYSWWPYDWEFGATQSVARSAETVVVIAENIGWNTFQRDLVEQLPTDKMIYVSLWKPYEWEEIQRIDPNTPGFVAVYSTWNEAQIALCNVLSGVVPARGQLPMPIDGYGLGHGLQWDAVLR